jgi:photosystem II reaction center protein PsbP
MNNRNIISTTVCFAAVFTVGLVGVINLAYAILGLPDNFNNNNDVTNSSNYLTDTGQQQQPPQQQATEGFSLYQDPASLFTIQYPSHWQPVAKQNGDVVFTSPLDFSSGRHISMVSIGIKNVNATTLDQLVSQFKSSNATKPFFEGKTIDESPTTLAGLPAHKIETEDLVYILALKDGKQYLVSYQLGQLDDLPIVEQMIYSFQIH